jgi:hypothetical protein
MENQELLNPGSENSKKDQGAENLNPEQELQEQKEDIQEETQLNETSDEEKTVEEIQFPEPVQPEMSEILASADVDTEDSDENQIDAEDAGTSITPEDDSPAEVVAAADESENQDTPEKAMHVLNIEDSDHDEDDEEIHEDEEIDAGDLAARYNSMSKEELVESLEKLVQSDDIVHIRKHIGFIRLAFRNYLKEQHESEFQKALSEEGEVVEEKPEIVAEKQVDILEERFEAAFAVYKDKKSVFDQSLEKQKQENLLAKESILEEIRNLIESEEELKKTYDLFKDLQEKWRQIGPVPQNSKNTLWNNYHFLVERFFDKVKINKELRDLDLRKNLENKTELCEKAEELLLEPSINKSFQKLQKLHEAWKETGPVPKDKKDEIWDRFKAASDAINDRRQSYYDSLREDQNKNYAAKVLLCEQAEKLATFTSDSPKKWQDATEQVNELFKVWKSVGFAPKKANDEVWVRFRNALDGFFNNKKEFFFKYKDEQTENYNQKLNLCLQAEALKDSQDWKSTTDELISLQQQWKRIGPVPKKFSDKIWKRFRAACDEFFNRKSEYFSNIGEKQDENLKMKRELIETIKTFKFTADNNENLNTLKDFQRQWMEIGHVPIKEKDKLQNEFRKLINDLFTNLNINQKTKSTMGFKNKVENMKNSPNADNVIYREKVHIVNKINGLQNDIKLWENNIGFFASSKKADILKLEFEKKIEQAKADIVVLEEKLRILNAS